MTNTAKTTTGKKPAKTSKAEEPAKAPRVTNGERLAQLAAQPDGFTIEEIIEMLGVQPHTARAMISVELRTKRKMNVVLDRVAGRYRILPPA